jgi:hypothetical protein
MVFDSIHMKFKSVKSGHKRDPSNGCSYREVTLLTGKWDLLGYWNALCLHLGVVVRVCTCEKFI